MISTKPDARNNGQMANRIASNGVDFTMPEFFTTTNFPKPAVRLDNWLIATTTITPELAEAMLRSNSDVQRNLRKRTVLRYTTDIQSGYWRLTHQGIAFDRYGKLIDGQHRLSSIIKAGTSVKMLVFFGVGGNDEMAVIDVGANRTANDAAKTMCIAMEPRHAAIIRMLFGNGLSGLSHAQVLNYFEIHHDAIVYGASKSRGLSSGVAGAITSAYYHCDTSELDRFVSVLKLDIPATNPGDRMAVLLNKYLNESTENNARKRDNLRDVMLKSQRAIQAFMNKENITKLQAQSQPIYRIPIDGQRIS